MNAPQVVDDNGRTIDVGMWVDAGDPAQVTGILELEPDFDYEVNRYVGGGVKLEVRYRDGVVDELWTHNTRTSWWDEGAPWHCEDAVIIGDGSQEPPRLTASESGRLYESLMAVSF